MMHSKVQYSARLSLKRSPLRQWCTRLYISMLNLNTYKSIMNSASYLSIPQLMGKMAHRTPFSFFKFKISPKENLISFVRFHQLSINLLLCFKQGNGLLRIPASYSSMLHWTSGQDHLYYYIYNICWRQVSLKKYALSNMYAYYNFNHCFIRSIWK